MTFFMLLEGPTWVERFYVLLALGVPYAVALGLIVAILDLIPLAGATIAAILIGVVAFLHTIVAGIVVVVFFIVYQQVENHLLQPVVYGRTVQLSPLAVLISVLIGAELAGILGALAAIPVAGALQVIIRDVLAHRRARILEPAAGRGLGRIPPSDRRFRRRMLFPGAKGAGCKGTGAVCTPVNPAGSRNLKV